MPEQVSETFRFLMIKRSLFNHPFWKEQRTFSKCEAWLDLIQQARFEQLQARELIKGKLIKWNRGELVASVRFLSVRWNWGKSKVAEFLKLLEIEEMISRRTDQGETIISLINYDSYNPTKRPSGHRGGQSNPLLQSIPKEPPDSEADSRRTVAGQSPDKTNKENNEEIRERDAPPQKTDFEKFKDWLKKNANRVLQMSEPFTEEQYLEARKNFENVEVKDVLKSMHNHKPLLKDNVSAYLTMCNWIKRRRDNNPVNGSAAKDKNGTETNFHSTLRKI